MKLNKRRAKATNSAVERLWPAVRRNARAFTLWVVGLATASIATVLAASFSGLFQSVLPDPSSLACFATRHFERSASDSEYAVIVANVNGDLDGEVGARLVSDIRERTGLPVMTSCDVITVALRGNRDLAGEEAERRGSALLRRRKANLLLWGERRRGEDGIRIWFSHPYADGTVGHAGHLVTVDSVVAFIDGPFADALLGGAETFAIPNLHSSVDELLLAASKLEALWSARPPRYWEAMSTYRTATLKALQAQLLTVAYENATRPRADWVETAVEHTESAFRLVEYDPLTPPPLGTGLGVWRVHYLSQLQHVAKTRRDPASARQAVAIASGMRDEELGVRSRDPTLSYQSVAGSYLLLFRLAAAPADRDSAIINAREAIRRMKVAGVPHSGRPPTDSFLLRHYREDPSSVQTIENQPAFKILRELGFSDHDILLE